MGISQASFQIKRITQSQISQLLRFNNDCLQTRNVKVVVRVIMVSLLSHCEINFSCFIEALDSKGILRTVKKGITSAR